MKSTGSIDGAKAVGKLLAERAKAAKVQAVVFDRGGRMYHGRVKALAEASREGGCSSRSCLASVAIWERGEQRGEMIGAS